MEQLARVQKLNGDGTAQVIHVRQSACSGDCHKCSGCGAVSQTMVITARNPIGAAPGQTVTVKAESGPVLAAAAVLYILPLVLFFAGYLLSHLVWQQGALGGGVAFVLGIVIAFCYDRFVVRKSKTVYTITEFAQPMFEYEKKGDNDLD